MSCKRCPDGSIVCSRSPDPCSEFDVVDVMSLRMSMDLDPDFPEIDEDKCHEISVLVQRQDDKCRARLWCGPGDPPGGWIELGSFTIRVRTGKDTNGDCAAKINFEGCPEPEPEEGASSSA